jgi:hypothetical protein
MAINLANRVILGATGVVLLIAFNFVYFLKSEIPEISDQTFTAEIPFHANFAHFDSFTIQRDPKEVIYAALKPLDRFVEMRKFPLPNKVTKENLQDRFVGCLRGMAIADAYSLAFLHSPLNSSKMGEELPQDHFPDNLNTNIFSPGDFSLNTSLSLVLAASLVQKRVLTGRDLVTKLQQWHTVGFMSSGSCSFGHGPSLRKYVDNGFLLDLVEPADEAISIARLAPVILFYSLRDIKTCKDASAASVLLTHAHKNCLNAARILATVIWTMLHSPTLGKKTDKTAFFTLQFSNTIDLPDSLKFLFSSYHGFLEDPRHLTPDTSEGALYFALKAFKETDTFFDGLASLFSNGIVDTAACTIYGMIAGTFYPDIPLGLKNRLYAGPYLDRLGSLLTELAVDPIFDARSFSESRPDDREPILDKKSRLVNSGLSGTGLPKTLQYFVPPE